MIVSCCTLLAGYIIWRTSRVAPRCYSSFINIAKWHSVCTHIYLIMDNDSTQTNLRSLQQCKLQPKVHILNQLLYYLNLGKFYEMKQWKQFKMNAWPPIQIKLVSNGMILKTFKDSFENHIILFMDSSGLTFECAMYMIHLSKQIYWIYAYYLPYFCLFLENFELL